MNIKLLSLILLIVLGIGALVVVIPKKQQFSSPPSAPQVTEQTTPQGQTVTGETRYVVFSKSAFDQAKDKKRVLYFYANWCPICRPIDVEFRQNMSKIPQDVVVIRVNYNDSETNQETKDLAKQYGITYQHTFVQIDAQGKKIALWNGGGLNELLQNIK